MAAKKRNTRKPKTTEKKDGKKDAEVPTKTTAENGHLQGSQDIQRPSELSFKYASKDITLAVLKANLKNQQAVANQRTDFEDILRQKTALEEIARGLREESNAALEEEEQNKQTAGSSDRYKAAKRNLEQAEANLQNFQSGHKTLPTATARRNAHFRRLEATARYEDFLFYQINSNRFERLEELGGKPQRSQKRKNTGTKLRPGYKLVIEHPHPNFLIKALDTFDDMKVGVYGNPSNTLPNAFGRHDNIPPEDLHLWYPVQRRERRGIGIGESRPERPRPREEPRMLELDLEAIENERQRAENDRGGTDLAPSMTHTERRNMESKAWENHSTARLEFTKDRNLRTDAGLFIAAAETSDDWLISYDQLGPVVPGRTVAKGEPGPKMLWPSNLRETSQGSHEDWIPTTSWAEHTFGRREYHVFHRNPPSSPVDSPPHSPIADVRHRIPSDFLVESRERDTYREQFRDHYGNMGRPSNQPGRSRMPYEPQDIPKDVSNLSQENSAKRSGDVELDKQERHPKKPNLLAKPALEGSAMNMYRAIAGAARDPCLWEPGDTEPYDDEDDVEDDIFREAYHDGSRRAAVE
jgi:hypothetical protein